MTDYSKLTDAELDVLIAERVMGWVLETDDEHWPLRWYSGTGKHESDLVLWTPSTNELDILEVLRKALGDGYGILIRMEDDLYRIGVYKYSPFEIENATASTPTRALCEAILAAYEVKHG